MRTTRTFILAGVILLLGSGVLGGSLLVPSVRGELRALIGRATVAGRVREVESRVRPIWTSRLPADAPIGTDSLGTDSIGTDSLGIESLTLLVLKRERVLVVYASGPRLNGPVESGPGESGPAESMRPRPIATYDILAASGTPGPKLRQGDQQVPEGFYPITFLNPNSRYRLSMRIGYPSADDTLAARADGRDLRTLGGDIMIHGSNKSVGCVAIGDPAIEELFWLVAHVGIEHTHVVIVPSREPLTQIDPAASPWLAERYRLLDAKLRELGE